ncbi:MAG TPA: hypothetical protein PKA05_20070 [Roseiflexaceae bacterium]|nr:hypothetical protein [Roseiflexaceae bacterium]
MDPQNFEEPGIELERLAEEQINDLNSACGAAKNAVSEWWRCMRPA